MNAKILVVAPALALAAACSGSKSQANLSLSAQAAAPGTTSGTSTSLDLGNGISLDRVRVVIRKLKLEGTVAQDGATSAAPGRRMESDGGADGETEMEKEQDDSSEPVLGPFLIDLSGAMLSSGVQQLLDGLVPPGAFRELKLVVGPVSAEQAGADSKLAEMAARNASIVVDGTIDGKAFSFVSGLVAEVDEEGDLVVDDAKSNNITVSIIVENWFGGTGSARLDPTDAANQSAIEANIKASIEAFEDDDRDGHDDRPGHG